MAKRGQAKAAAEERRGPKGSPLFKGHEKVTFSLPPELAAGVQREALRRAVEAGTRPNASAIAVEALEAWLAKNAKR